jgi:hypothetical protein
MRKIFGVEIRDAIPFLVCTLIFVALNVVWLVVPLIDTPTGPVSIADSDMSFIRGVVPVIGDLPPQSISRFFVTATLYLLALLYGLWSLATSEYRRDIVQFLGLSVITFLAWVALNYWVIAGFLNSPNTLLNGAIAIVLLMVWMGGVSRFVSRLHDPTALFLVRFGIGLATFISIAQVLLVATSDWRSPTQGIPVLYTLTFNAIVGIFLAGAGGNMLWRERRMEALAAGRKRR